MEIGDLTGSGKICRWRLEIGDGDRRSDWIRQNMTLEIGDWRWRSEMIFCFIFYFRPEEPAAPVLTSPADSLRDSRYGPRRGRTQQAGAAPHGLGADAPQEDHYSGLAAPPSEMCRRKIGDDAAVSFSFFDNKKLTTRMVPPHRKVKTGAAGSSGQK